MTHLNDSLRRTYAHLAHRPLPAAWTAAQPVLVKFATPAAVVDAIRDVSDTGRSDTLVRALLALAQIDQQAALVLLEAIVPTALARLGSTSPEYREDVLVDLACVILESHDIGGLDRLAYRLAGRATQRTRRRLRTERRWSDYAVPLDVGLDYVEPSRPADDVAIARVRLEGVGRRITAAIDSGELLRFEWDEFRDGRLGPALGYPRSDINKDRLYHRGEEVRRLLLHAS